MLCPKCQKEIASGSKFCYNCGSKLEETAAPVTPPVYVPPKKLVRSSNDKKIAGVCAGLADYFDMDVTLIRVLWLLATLVPGPNIIVYIVLWIVLPVGVTGVHVPAAGSTTAHV